LSSGDVLRRDRPADREQDVTGVLRAQQLDHARDQRHVGTREDREADRVGVLLQHGLDDLLRRLVQSGVDHLHPRIAQGSRDDLRAAIAPVQAGLGDDDAQHQKTGTSV
jgi:hypothetical protein